MYCWKGRSVEGGGGRDGEAPELRAERIGEADVDGPRPVVEGVPPPPGPVDELVADDEVPRGHVRLERTAGAGAHDPRDAELLEGPEVGPVVDGVGRQRVVPGMTGDEGDAP